MLADASSTPHPTGAKPRLSGAERRAAIVEAAINLFSQNGFRGTTTRQLASAVGVSEPVLYQHFATKKDLYDAIVDHLIQQTSATFHQSLTELGEEYDEERFFHWLGALILDWYETRTREVRLLLLGALEGHELAKVWHERAITEFLTWVEGYFQSRAESGAFVATNAQLSARAFIGMVANYGQTTMLFPHTTLNLSSEQVVTYFVELYLNGVRTR